MRSMSENTQEPTVEQEPKVEEAPLPTRIDELDLVRLQLQRERNSRISAEMMAAQLTQQRLNGEMQQAERDNAAMESALKIKYRLVGNDEIYANGSIVRAPQPKIKE